MTYRRFLLFNVAGGALWVFLFVPAGYFFGSVPFVKNNFSLVIIALVLIPGIPALVEVIRMQLRKRKARADEGG
jgi:membrane-associated protein